MKPRLAAVLIVAGIIAALLWHLSSRSTDSASSPSEMTGLSRKSSVGDNKARQTLARSRAIANAPPNSVSGRVTHSITEKPMAGVDVIFKLRRAENIATSNDRGQYHIDLLPGTYDVRAIGDGVYAVNPPRAHVPLSRQGVQYNVSVTPLATIHGRVQTENRDPVSGASVHWMTRTADVRPYVKTGELASESTTDSSGRFELSVPHGKLVLQASNGNTRGQQVVDALLAGTVRRGITITLKQPYRAITITGTVLSPTGTPIADAEVFARTQDDWAPSERWLTVTTNRSGRFEFPPLRFDKGRIEASANGYGPSLARQFRLADVQKSRNFVLTLTPDKVFVLAGRVVNDNGEPIADVEIAHGRRHSGKRYDRTATANDGTFRFESVGSGSHYLRARKPGYLTQRQHDVKAPNDKLTLTLVRTGGIQGKVTTENGASPTQFTITAILRKRRGPKVSQTGNPNGDYLLNNLAPGRYSIIVSASGYAETTRIVEVKPGDLSKADMTLQRGHTVHGSIRGSSGAPIESATVKLTTGRRTVVTDDNGDFTLPNVAPGRHALTLSHPRHGAHQHKVVIENRDTTVPPIVLKPKKRRN